MQVLELLKQRRIWASIFGTIAFILPLFGVKLTLDVENLTNSFLALFEAISGILAVILPIISYFKPKK